MGFPLLHYGVTKVMSRACLCVVLHDGSLPDRFPFDQPAGAGEDRVQVIDAKHRLNAGGQRSTRLDARGLGLTVDGIGQADRARIVHGGLAAGGWLS